MPHARRQVRSSHPRRDMDLIINGPAVALSSLGVRRYFSSVMHHLSWRGKVEIISSGRWRVLERPRELLRRGRDGAIFWTPCQRGPLRARNHVITVHDCINVEYVYRNDWRLPVYRQLFNQVLDGAAAVVAISRATRAALLRNYRVDEAKIRVIQSGYDPLDASTTRSEGRHHSSTSEPPFILMVTNAFAYKNSVAACRALAQSRAARANVGLRVIGNLPAEAVEACERAGVRLEVRSGVPERELQESYERCLFLLSPSLAEGHNLPIAEALSAGANVLASDIDVHREYYTGCVSFFDPHEEAGIAAAIDAALERPGRWFDAACMRHGRSFAEVASEYEAVFESIGSCR